MQQPSPDPVLADADAGALFRLVETFFSSTNRSALTKGQQGLNASAGSLVYGEVTTPVRIFNALRLQPEDTFADLGSGRGQIVLAAAMHAPATPNMSIGIEFHSGRDAEAKHALSMCPSSIQNKVRTICADALTSDLGSITKAFICNPTFGGPLTSQFADALHPSRSPRLECVATIAQIPEPSLAKNHLRLAEISAVGVSWAPAGTALFVYERTAAGTTEGAPPPAVVDRGLLDKVVADRRASAQQQRQAGIGSEAEMERGLLRTALLAASL